MNWENYKKWLLENILHRETEQNKYTLLPSAQEKYELAGGEELEEALNDFLASVERKYGDITYYPLREWKEGKSWKELFPERREVLFGMRSKEIPPSEKAWNELIKLYNYWGTEKERESQLRGKAEKLWAEVKQEGKEILTSLVSEISEENNFFARYQDWLSAYELLGQEAQQNLKAYKELVEKDQNSLRNGTERQVKRQQWWVKKMEEVEEMIEEFTNQLRIFENKKPQIGNLRIFLISLFTSLVVGAIVLYISKKWYPHRVE